MAKKLTEQEKQKCEAIMHEFEKDIESFSDNSQKTVALAIVVEILGGFDEKDRNRIIDALKEVNWEEID